MDPDMLGGFVIAAEYTATARPVPVDEIIGIQIDDKLVVATDPEECDAPGTRRAPQPAAFVTIDRGMLREPESPVEMT